MNLYSQNATGNVHKDLQTARSIIALPERASLSDRTYPLCSQARWAFSSFCMLEQLFLEVCRAICLGNTVYNINCKMMKRIHRDITWIPRGYIFSAVQFSRGIHVVSIIVSTRIRLPFIIGCLLENSRGSYVAYLSWQRREFYGLFLLGIFCGQ